MTDAYIATWVSYALGSFGIGFGLGFMLSAVRSALNKL